MTPAPRDWVAFWDSENSIYVSARHRDVHYAGIAEGVAAYIPSADATVLDYGCGEALHADRVAARCGWLILCEAAPGLRAHLAERFRDNPKIEVMSPEAVSARAPGSIDLITMISVAQYLSPQALEDLLAKFRTLLRPSGALVLGDIVAPGITAVADASSLLRFATERRFLPAALLGLVRTAFSDYRRLRFKIGLTTYDERAFLDLLRRAGFSGERQPRNIGHNQHRMTFVARPV